MAGGLAARLNMPDCHPARPYSFAEPLQDPLEHELTYKLSCKIPDIPKRRRGILKVRTIIKRGAVVFLHPSFFDAELIQRGDRAPPLRLSDSSRE